MADLKTNSAMEQQNQPEGKSQIMRVVALVVMLAVIGVIWGVAYYMGKAAERTAEKEFSLSMDTYIYGKTTDINTWFKTLVDQGDRFASNESITLFADLVAQMGDNAPVMLNSPNSELNKEQAERLNIQYMRNTLIDFVSFSEFASGRMLTVKGESYLSTENVPQPLTDDQKKLVASVATQGKPVIGQANNSPTHGLVVDIFLPVFPYQYENAASKKPAAVLLLTKVISPKLREIISSGAASRVGGETIILQKSADALQDLGIGRSDGVRTLKHVISPAEDGGIDFAQRESILHEGKPAYSQGKKVSWLDWWVVQEVDYETARGPLNQTLRTIYIVAGLSTLVFIFGFGVLWWSFVGRQQKQVLSQVQNLFSVIEEQKRLLDGINSTIADPISLTDPKGIYRYVNRAFAQHVGREAADIVGLDTAAVFGFDTAKRLNSSDQHVMMTGEGVTTNETIWLQSRKHLFQISKTPLREAGVRTPQGIVSVFRDLTQVMEAEERTRRVVQQTIDILVQAIEEADPFLGGHSRIMSGIAVLIGKALQFSEADVATIQSAANLSQIGKMYVPREILTKPGMLTPEEKKIMEQHIEYTKNMVSRIDFGLPVVDAIYQMYERLDGQGYPAGLKDKDINIYARVLAVANAFTAMARPRSYRPALGTEEAIAIMQKQKESYDQRIVEVLREVLKTPAGERYVQMAAASKAL